MAKRITKKAATNGNGKAQVKFAPTAKITVLVEGNPKRPKSKEAKRFAKYRNGQTVAQALEAGMAQQNLRRDVERKCIRIGG